LLTSSAATQIEMKLKSSMRLTVEPNYRQYKKQIL
jgi:hypothetical protein